MQQQAQGRENSAGNLVLVFDDSENVRSLRLSINGSFVFAKLNQRTQSDAKLTGMGEQSIGDMDCVLPVGKVKAFFHYKIIDLIAPDGQTHVETKFAQRGRG